MDVLHKETIEMFNRNLESTIKACGFTNVIEVLEHAPGVVSVMTRDLDMLIIYSAKLCSSRSNTGTGNHIISEFCKTAQIGTVPFYIRGALGLKDFLKEELVPLVKISWHENPRRISFEKELQLNAA